MAVTPQDPVVELLELAREQCVRNPSARIGLARALGIDAREVSRYLRSRRSKPNGARALALYAWVSKTSGRQTWLPWEKAA